MQKEDYQNSTKRPTISESQYCQQMLLAKIHRLQAQNYHLGLENERSMRRVTQKMETNKRLRKRLAKVKGKAELENGRVAEKGKIYQQTRQFTFNCEQAVPFQVQLDLQIIELREKFNCILRSKQNLVTQTTQLRKTTGQISLKNKETLFLKNKSEVIQFN